MSRNNQVCYLNFNRPEALNALNNEMISELYKSLQEAETEETVKVVVLTGEGDKAFVAGADIKEFLSLKSAEEAEQYSKNGQTVFNYIEEMSKPVIAAINGYALGGGLELALACDFRIAAEEAKVGMPEITLGLFPGYGGAQRLPRLTGKGRALYLMMTGKSITAIQAEQWGLVEAVYPIDTFYKEVDKLAAAIAAYPAAALASLKKRVVYGEEQELKQALAMDSKAVGELMVSEEAVALAHSFVAKKKG